MLLFAFAQRRASISPLLFMSTPLAIHFELRGQFCGFIRTLLGKRRLVLRAGEEEHFLKVEKALRHRQPGPYQLQAAIAAMHAQAKRFEDTDWSEIDRLYAVLETVQPSPVVTLNRAVAVAKVRGPAAALAMIEPLAAALGGYFNFFGVKGALLMQLDRMDEARAAFDQAIALANTTAEAAHIRSHLDRLMKDSKAKRSA